MLLITTGMSLAVAIGTYSKSSRLQESDLRFRIARQLSPALTTKADSIYYEDPDRAELETQKREAHELNVKEAEAILSSGELKLRRLRIC
ncbi:hypothetical protein [Dyadobacter alkalitolerans]|uniref:hypothetical protein n=1 Tax=Dyadobacter alkalitolerans TaxID=492736 RepID=UPI0004291BDA|nr:hypothetical protein [Dyadobacter alkalitolerans]